MKAVTLLTLLLVSTITVAQSIISGKVTDENNAPIIGANVYLEGTYDGTSSDINGAFTFKTEEDGPHQLIVTFIGYQTYARAINLPADLQLDIELKEEINRLDAVVISAGSFSAGEENNREVLKPLDIVTTAGATADIAGALNTLPGTQTVGETGRLFVRGGEGYETKTFIDGMEVLNSYSPSAPNTPSRGRFSPFMFSGTSFSTGGYSAEYGQALSSALILNTKDMPAQNRTDLSLMSVGADVAHSQLWDKSSLSAKIQYTNLEPYFQLVKQRIHYDKAPQAVDGNMAYRHKVGETGMFKVYGNFSRSDFVIYQPQIIDETIEDKYDLSNNYNYLNFNYSDMLNKKWSMRWGASGTRSQEDITINNEQYNESESGTHLKSVWTYDGSASYSISFGAEHFYRESNFDIKEFNDLNYTYTQHLAASFAESDIYLSNDFVLRSGLRLAYDNLTNDFTLFPRTSLAYKVGDNGQVSLAYGQFGQQAQADYLRVNTQLKPEKATHYIINYQVINPKQTFRIEAYYKKYNDLIKFTDSYDRSTFSNRGNGYAKGFDVFWRDNKTFKGLDYWVSYSFIDTQRDYKNYPERAIPSFSATHNFSIVAKYFIQSLKTQVGGTYSFASSRPYNNPNLEGFNSQRTPAYHDLSINLSYLYRSNVIIHASVTNVLGVDNIFGYEYSQQPQANGDYVGRPIKQPASRFAFLGVFITLAKNKAVNQMPNL